MVNIYVRLNTLLAALLLGSVSHCMDNASQLQALANQDLLNAASQGNCASIRNALHRKANPNCFGIAKPPAMTAAPTIAPAALSATETVGLLATSVLPNTQTKIIATQPVVYVPVTPTIECTPIHLAAKHGHYDAVKILLEAGANAQLATHTNTTTPLHAAIQSGSRDAKTLSQARADIAALLIKHGASLYAKDCAGKTALDYLHPADQESTNAKQTIINNYQWKQGTYYGTWVCGTLVVSLICIGIQQAYNRYYRSHRNKLDEDTQETQEPHIDNGADHEKQ
jgi:hypothetical protein